MLGSAYCLPYLHSALSFYLLVLLNLLKRIYAGFPPRRPGFASGQHVGIVVDKEALEQVFSEYFGFPCQSFHQFLNHRNYTGLARYAIGGRSAEWAQFASTPYYTN
jgi:hypothetical protein